MKAKESDLNFWKTWLADRDFKLEDRESTKEKGCEWVRGYTRIKHSKLKKRPWDCWIESPEGQLGKTHGDTPESAMEMLKMLCGNAAESLSTSRRNQKE